MPKVLKEDIKKRSKELRLLGQKQCKNYLSTQIGTIQNVLTEKNGKGYTPNFSKILFNEDVNPGLIISVEIISANSINLIGKPIKN